MWRCVEFDPVRHLFCGVNSSTCGLFEFDPERRRFENVADVQPAEAHRVHPTLTFTRQKGGNCFYAPADGLFDYSRSEDVRSPSFLVRYDPSARALTQHGQITGRKGEIVYGALGGKSSDDGKLYLIAAVSGPDRKAGIFRFGTTAFNLALVEMDVAPLC
jgi:hypothetical protein